MNVLCATASYTPPATGRRSVRAATLRAGVITVIAAGAAAGAGGAGAGSAEANAGNGRASAVTVASRIDNGWDIGPPERCAERRQRSASCSWSVILPGNPTQRKHSHMWTEFGS